MHSIYPIPQEAFASEFLPWIQESGKLYRKKVNIFARISSGDEFIETFTKDGKETQNTTVAGDVIVKNPGGEIYVIKPEQLERRYIPLDNYDGEWREYKAIGVVSACMWEESTIEFIASWDQPMVIKHGDMLATNDSKTLYRIARQEFEETYEPM